MDGFEVVDAAGALWFARPDIDNAVKRLPDGSVPWEWGRIDFDGTVCQGDWLDKADALAAVADVLLDDRRRDDAEDERRRYG